MINQTLITKDNYPELFKACILLALDAGAINRDEMKRQKDIINFSVSLDWTDKLQIVEDGLKLLNENEIAEFATGEEVERNRIMIDKDLGLVDELFQEVYDSL